MVATTIYLAPIANFVNTICNSCNEVDIVLSLLNNNCTRYMHGSFTWNMSYRYCIHKVCRIVIIDENTIGKCKPQTFSAQQRKRWRRSTRHTRPTWVLSYRAMYRNVNSSSIKPNVDHLQLEPTMFDRHTKPNLGLKHYHSNNSFIDVF